MGSVRTPIIGGPRPLPGLRRAARLYTLNCEEPETLWASASQGNHEQGRMTPRDMVGE